jgi:hypothetical protein
VVNATPRPLYSQERPGKPERKRGVMGKKQDREEKFLIGIPDTGRDHLQDEDVQRRETQLFHCMTPRLNPQARGVVM